MKLVTGLLFLGLAPLALTSCESITGIAPEGTPRVEVELNVAFAPNFLGALHELDESSDLAQEIRDSILTLADLGLRFYPIPSHLYAQGNVRPPHVLVVELTDLEVGFEYEDPGPNRTVSTVPVKVERIAVEVSTSIVMRRAQAPSLIIGRTTADAEVKAESDAEVLATNSGHVPVGAGGTLLVLDRDVREAVDRAVRRALLDLRTPIDREFANARLGVSASGR